MIERRGGELRALEQLVRERRSESVPELDWERLEARLLERARSEPQPTDMPRPRRFRMIAIAAAAAVALAAGFGAVQKARTTTSAAPAVGVQSTESTGVSDGTQLAVGDRIVSGAHEARVEHSGVASWTLAPYGAAVLVATGDFLTVRLDAGKITAEVVPASRSESFAIEVGETRVAVHGTRFSVERSADHLVVDVSDGTVVVGPRGTPGGTHGFTLKAPARGQFGFDGKTGSIETLHAALPGARHERPSAALRSGPMPGAPPVEAPQKELTPTPSIGDVEEGVARVNDVMNDCFARYTHADQGTRVTATVAVTLTIAPDGHITERASAPPLAPDVEACSQQGVGRIRFTPSRDGIRITRHLELVTR